MGESLNQQGKFEPYIKGDIGVAREVYGGFHELYFWTYAKSLKCIGIFVGHQHKIATSVVDDGIRITYGLKTGTYDYHSSDMLGSVKITLSKADFNVEYLYSNIKYPHA